MKKKKSHTYNTHVKHRRILRCGQEPPEQPEHRLGRVIGLCRVTIVAQARALAQRAERAGQYSCKRRAAAKLGASRRVFKCDGPDLVDGHRDGERVVAG